MEAARIASVLRHLAPGSSAATPAAAAAAEAPPRVRVQEEHYYTYAELKAVCEEVAAAYPTLCSLSSIGRSREGRELWLLTLTDLSTGPAEAKPAYCIYGNIHASEPTGAHAAVYNAVHLCEGEGGPTGLLRRATVYIIPRVAVDGAEYCVTTGGRLRSRKWDTAGEVRVPNRLYPADINGSGTIADMRIEDPSGEWVVDSLEPRLMAPRTAGHPGPFYRLLQEGLIHEFDGDIDSIVDPRMQGAEKDPRTWDGVDFNRQWPSHWRSSQKGAGDYPFSELEMHHLGTFLHTHPKIHLRTETPGQGIMGYHTGIYCVLRLGSQPHANSLINEADDQAIEQLAQQFGRRFPSVCDGSDAMGIPAVPPTKLHPDGARDTSYHGHSFDSFYYHFGMMGFEIELGIAENVVMSGADSIALPRDGPSGTGGEQRLGYTRQLLRHWDATGRAEPLFVDWVPYEHPQLGRVEVGGMLETPHMNPMMATMGPIMRGCHESILLHAKMHPWVQIEESEATPVEAEVGRGVYRVRARVANRGELPTHVTNHGRSLARFAPVRASFVPAEGVELLSAQGHVELGHLAGVTGSGRAEWFVRTAGEETPGKLLGQLRVQGSCGGDVSRDVLAQ